MRRQSGTTSLRALLYFDEIFGYFPPTAEPPSKRPLLTLLKQARAFGLGCVLVTQNPVDLDYKGLTNAGTWFIGKLQAERDKERVLAGLKGALAEAGQGSAPDYDKIITRLGNRVFLMHNVHDARPQIFTTRWAMSYLRGPLTQPQVRQLMADRKPKPAAAGTGGQTPAAEAAQAGAAATAAAATTSAPVPAAGAETPAGFLANAPGLDPALPQVYLPVVVDERAAVRHLANERGGQVDVKAVQLLYEPGVLGLAGIRFADAKRRVDGKVDYALLAWPGAGAIGLDWAKAEPVPVESRKVLKAAESAGTGNGPFYAEVPDELRSSKQLTAASKELSDWLYYNASMRVNVHPELGLAQDPDEDARAFRIRLQQAARERRDAEVDKLTKQYEKQIAGVSTKLEKAQQNLSELQAKAQAKQTEQWVNIGESVFNFFAGRRSSRAVSNAASKMSQASQAAANVQEAQQNIEKLAADQQALQAELAAKTQEITERWEGVLDALVVEELKPKRSDVDVRATSLAWAPRWRIVYNATSGEEATTLAAYYQPEVG
jgi:hypothetical protein